MIVGKVYKLKIDNGIERDPYYMIMKLLNGDCMLFWERGIAENTSWLMYDAKKVERNLNSGWELVEIDDNEKIGE